MDKNFLSIGIVIIIIIISVIIFLYSQQPSLGPIPTSDDLISQECGVCGPKGDHNLYGKECAKGLECTNAAEGIASSVYFCVKPGESIKACLGK